MARSKLEATLAKKKGVAAYISKDDSYETDEELREAIFESRIKEGASGAELMADSNRRNTLMRAAGFDYFDIANLKPNPENIYSIDDESVKNLAALIKESGHVEPLVVRKTAQGIFILSGHRRWMACKLLTQEYGDQWRMVMARCFEMGQISDEDAKFILHAENMGQRDMSPSERAEGFKAVADRVVQQRKSDPSMKGKRIREILAEQFGVSERVISTELAIAKSLPAKGKELLDQGIITKAEAESIARLPEENRDAVIEVIASNDLDFEERSMVIAKGKEKIVDASDVAGTVAAERKAERRKAKTDDYLKKAYNALKRASATTEDADPILIGKIKAMLKEIENTQEY